MAQVVESGLLPAPPRVTWQEFHDGLGEDDRAEWVGGEVVPRSPVSIEHHDLSGFVWLLLREYAKLRGGRAFHDNFVVRFAPGGSARVPDVSFLTAEHLDRLTQTYIDGVPDVMVEIVSPESGARDRGEKFYEYEAAGVAEYWLLDPHRRQADFYQLADGGVFRSAQLVEGRFVSTTLPGFWLDVQWLWQWPEPSTDEIVRQWALT